MEFLCMPVQDLRAIPTDATLEADVCIVGSGPAGATIALELANGNSKVIVVESGGLQRNTEVDQINEIESIGWPRIMDQWLVRNRMLGGTSNTWAGRCAPLDEIDYQARDWVPHSGWPVGFDELTPYLDRSISHLGLAAIKGYIAENSFWTSAKRRRPAPRFDDKLLSPVFWQFSEDSGNSRRDVVNFGQRLLRNKACNINVILNATVTHLNTSPSGTAIESVDLRTATGERRKVSAPNVILCAGGIENARLLLVSNRAVPNGLGNRHDLVGRYLMDHLKGKIGGFDSRYAKPLRSLFGRYLVKSGNGRHWFHQGVRLSAVAQREQSLLNCALFLDEHEFVAPDDPWMAIRRMIQGKGSLIGEGLSVASNAPFVAYGLYEYLVRNNSLPRKLTEVVIRCIVEQRPDPDSRVTLSYRTDKFGVPLSRINWRVSEQERKTVETTAMLFSSEVRRLGIAEFELENWIARAEGFPPHFLDIAHPTGTTRMSNDCRSGVVDLNCEVYGTNGLFIAGSSVFPTAGHANPTQMIVALAVRLADTLKRRVMNSGTR
jgi:choline dehydrogenase-like flavoprotein